MSILHLVCVLATIVPGDRDAFEAHSVMMMMAQKSLSFVVRFLPQMSRKWEDQEMANGVKKKSYSSQCVLHTDSLLLHCSLCFTHTRTQKGFGSVSSKYFDKHKMKFLWKCFQSCSVLALTFSIQAIKTSCTLTSFSLIERTISVDLSVKPSPFTSLFLV